MTSKNDEQVFAVGPRTCGAASIGPRALGLLHPFVRVCGVQPILAAIEPIVAHRDACSRDSGYQAGEIPARLKALERENRELRQTNDLAQGERIFCPGGARPPTQTMIAFVDDRRRQSGLLGVSGLSSDMRTLRQSKAPEAAEAVALFVYRIVREAGLMAAALGGGCPGLRRNRREKSPPAAAGGLDPDDVLNRKARGGISAAESRISAWILPTDEERMIARYTSQAVSA